MDSQEPPQIEFPCDYPVKVIMRTGDMHLSQVLAVVQEHAPELDELDARVIPSRHGNYGSLRVNIVATGESQLRAMHAQLMALPFVKMVL